jgi:threonine/homoserine/homoserine lactone efflux protein
VLTTAEFITYLLATIAVIATPGVTVSAVTGTTLSHGVAAGFGMELGAGLARLTMIAVLALGLEAVSGFMLAAFDWIKLAGAAYLIWIGIRTIRHPPRLEAAAGAPPEFLHQIASGFVVLWSNPKALIFFGAFVPQFVHPQSPVLPQVAFLGAIWLIVAALIDGAYILLAGSSRHLFRGRFSRWAGGVSGAVLIAAGAWLALQTKP